ncbi:hypothetical protein CCACVL1_15333 [Corchorus capsularis]|uniref:Uncharacterized protein n=1 Tax=Corchorus capsularis TaxID=210143 RepID=A0A1R3I2R3_COCAP|nr:hypothetical protein CCACVL1_15333 [Corchorus capsularis]
MGWSLEAWLGLVLCSIKTPHIQRHRHSDLPVFLPTY